LVGKLQNEATEKFWRVVVALQQVPDRSKYLDSSIGYFFQIKDVLGNKNKETKTKTKEIMGSKTR